MKQNTLGTEEYYQVEHYEEYNDIWFRFDTKYTTKEEGFNSNSNFKMDTVRLVKVTKTSEVVYIDA